MIIIRNYQTVFYRLLVSSTKHSAWNGKELLQHSLMSKITVPKRYIGVVPSHWSRFISENRAITFLLDNKSYCLKAVILNLLPTAALPTFCHDKPQLCQPKGRALTLLPLTRVTARAGEWQTGPFLSTHTQAELHHTQSNRKFKRSTRWKEVYLRPDKDKKGVGERDRKRDTARNQPTDG